MSGEASERLMNGLIPLGVAECCREWVVPIGMGRGGRCGICKEVPTFRHMLPEEEWLHVAPQQG